MIHQPLVCSLSDSYQTSSFVDPDGKGKWIKCLDTLSHSFTGYMELTFPTFPDQGFYLPFSQVTAFFEKWSNSWIVITFQRIGHITLGTFLPRIAEQRDLEAMCERGSSSLFFNITRTDHEEVFSCFSLNNTWPFWLQMYASTSVFDNLNLTFWFEQAGMYDTLRPSDENNRVRYGQQVHVHLTNKTRLINLHTEQFGFGLLRIAGQNISNLKLHYKWQKSKRIYPSGVLMDEKTQLKCMTLVMQLLLTTKTLAAKEKDAKNPFSSNNIVQTFLWAQFGQDLNRTKERLIPTPYLIPKTFQICRSHQNYEIFHFDEKQTWTAAHRFCRSNNRILPTVHDADGVKSLSAFQRFRYIFIGLQAKVRRFLFFKFHPTPNCYMWLSNP